MNTLQKSKQAAPLRNIAEVIRPMHRGVSVRGLDPFRAVTWQFAVLERSAKLGIGQHQSHVGTDHQVAVEPIYFHAAVGAHSGYRVHYGVVVRFRLVICPK